MNTPAQSVHAYFHKNPEVFHGVAGALQSAWQTALPEAGGDYHSRYATDELPELAVVVAPETVYANDYRMAMLGPLAFEGTLTSTTVTPEDEPADEATFDRLHIESLDPRLVAVRNRFEIFAMGKTHYLSGLSGVETSHNPEGEEWGPGQFGVAGAFRDVVSEPAANTIWSSSGGFQVDDHTSSVLGLGAGRWARDLGIEGELTDEALVRLESRFYDHLLESTERVKRIAHDTFGGKRPEDMTISEVHLTVNSLTGVYRSAVL